MVKLWPGKLVSSSRWPWLLNAQPTGSEDRRRDACMSQHARTFPMRRCTVTRSSLLPAFLRLADRSSSHRASGFAIAYLVAIACLLTAAALFTAPCDVDNSRVSYVLYGPRLISLPPTPSLPMYQTPSDMPCPALFGFPGRSPMLRLPFR